MASSIAGQWLGGLLPPGAIGGRCIELVSLSKPSERKSTYSEKAERAPLFITPQRPRSKGGQTKLLI